MMTIFLSREKIVKRAIALLALLILIGLGLQFYKQNRETITKYKPYYLKSYAYAAKHHLEANGKTATATASNERAKSVPVLVYHGVMEKNDNVSVSLEEFKSEMFALKAAGYQTVRLDEFNAYLQEGKQLPDKSFLLTFDDNRKDSFYPVDPILKELDYTALMFVITGTLDSESNNFHLTSEEILRMKRTGRWDLEAHTGLGHGLITIAQDGSKGHYYSNKTWLPTEKRLETDDEFRLRIRTDLLRARDDMKNILGISSYAFAFPFNDYARDSHNFPGAQKIFTEEVTKLYSLLFYQAEPKRGFSTNLAGSKAQFIKRINVETSWNAEDLLSILAEGREKALPLEMSTFAPDQGWINIRGILFFNKGQLNLNSEGDFNAASVLLDGTGSLQNYDLSIDANWKGSSSFMYNFNYRGSNDYQTVAISNDTLRISKITKDGERITHQRNIQKLEPNKDHKLHFRKAGDYLTVSIDGQDIATNISTSDINQVGGIGFEVWDPKPTNAVATIKHLRLTNLE